ncbi:MAG: hypothetical protein IRY90_16925 [Actinomadura rubrobrunea]|nr:hypothetical protein [Actinomadura rubrobrunea]
MTESAHRTLLVEHGRTTAEPDERALPWALVSGRRPAAARGGRAVGDDAAPTRGRTR